MNESSWSLFESTNERRNDETTNSNETNLSSLTDSHDQSTLESSVDLSLRASMISSSLGALLQSSSSSSNDNGESLPLDSSLSNTVETSDTIGETIVGSFKSLESSKSMESNNDNDNDSDKDISEKKNEFDNKENNSDLPSRSFFNIGSSLLSSESTNTIVGNWMESMDEATALSIAMKAQGLTTKIKEPKDMNVKDEYTCQLCQHFMVGASILECGHAFCTLCIEAHENPYWNANDDPFEEMKEEKDWIVLSNGNHSCPTCNEGYTRHIPCPTLDVSIYNYVKDQCSKSMDEYQSRMQIWTHKLQKRQNQLQKDRVEEVIRLQEQELLSYKKKKHVWRDIVGTALTTFTMIFITSMIGASRKKQ